MKKLNNYTFCILFYCIIIIMMFNLTNVKIEKYVYSVDNTNLDKHLESKIISIAKPIEDKEEKIEAPKKEEIKEKPIEKVEKPVLKENYTGIDTSATGSLETYTGIISFYGPDCQGCGNGQTASGYNVSSNKILYQDKTYGNIHIVAGDAKYPFGTIVRFTYADGSTPIVAVVLDRGGVGFGKRFQFDMLCESTARAYQIGIKKNTKIEILRLGY